MKTKRLINILILLVSSVSAYILISNRKGIIFIKIDLLIAFLSSLYLLITLFHKKTIKELIKKYQTKYLLGIIVISILSLYSYSFIIKAIPIQQEKEKYNHGKNISENKLYTFEKTKVNSNNYSIDKNIQKDSKDGEYKVLFNKESIPEVKINIHTNNLDYLRYNASKKPTVMANSISIDKYIVKYVGIKTKGQTTLYPITYSNNNLFSYNIKFKEYINKKSGFEENQNLLGLNKLSLNNMLGDPSKTKEYLSYYLLTEMNIPTPEYSYAKLTINNKYQGLYFMLEPIDKALTERTLKEKNDLLIKPETAGGDLVYDNRLDEYIDENGNYNFDSIVKSKKGNIKLPNNNILDRYNGIWENDVETLEDLYEQLPQFFQWMKKLNELSNLEDKNTEYYEEELNKILDVDSLIRYWAVNTYLVNSDSYTSQVKKNYALYISKEGKATILPWDYNYAFGASNMREVDQIINNNIYDPTINCELSERPLFNVIIGNNKYREQYENYLKDVLIIATEGGTTSDNKEYPKNNFKTIIDKNNKELIEAEKLNYQAFYTKEQINLAQMNLKEIIELRSQSVIKQLNHEESHLHSDIDYDSLGGYHSIKMQKWNTMTNKKD